MKIELKSDVLHDDYTQYICDNFDLKKKGFVSESIPFNIDDIYRFDWNIGVIYGGSGSGKTTILKNIGTVSTSNFDSSKSIISNFSNISPKEATELLTKIGLSSIPTLLKPYCVLSNGEKYRADLAYAIYSASEGDIILIDEYTSVVNRDVAKSMSFSIQKYVREKNIKIIFASCHYDIFDWLKPDWIYSPQNSGRIERCEYLRQRPRIEIEVSRCEPKVWDIFKKHHYLSEAMNKTAKCFVFEVHGQPVAFVSILPQPSGYYRNAWRISRTVVIPDFQGMGIGSAITDFLAGVFTSCGCRIFTKTIHMSLGGHRERSKKWRPTAKNGRELNEAVKKSAKHKNGFTRKSYCYEYVGDKIFGYEDLLLPITELRNK